MNRLTYGRASGICSCYWSPQRKEVLIERLGKYEDTGLTPQDITDLKEKYTKLKAAMEKAKM